MTAAVGVQGTKQSMGFDHVPDAAKTALRAFFLDEKHRVMLIGRIVHGHNQIPVLTRNPFLRGTDP